MRLRSVVAMGLLWGLAVLGFQLLVSARYAPERPDRVLGWTAAQSGLHGRDQQPYLLEPFLNQAVAWDSEFYLSIALRGYDDPAVRAVDVGPRKVSLDYAFFPLYPAVIRVVALPLSVVLNRIAAATLAGVLVSLLGAAGAAVALFSLVRADGSEARAWRTAFFFLVFPTSFFLLQVYTEGLFAGLAFGALALARHRRLGWAALLAVLATWTRAVGVCLALPIAWACLEELRARGRTRETLAAFLFALAPLAAFVVWKLSPLGRNFDDVERAHFQRGALDLAATVQSWRTALLQLWYGRPQTRVQYGLELGAAVAGVAASLATLRRMPGPSLFGLAAVVLPLSSGVAQGMPRFVLAVPSVFVLLGRMGERSEVLDRAWTVASLLLFGMLATLYTFDFWVA
jgi:hypothetical protein